MREMGQLGQELIESQTADASRMKESEIKPSETSSSLGLENKNKENISDHCVSL